MSACKKFPGIVAGQSIVAAISVADARSEPPNPFITNPAVEAGQPSTHATAVCATGVLASLPEVRTATITRQPEVAQVAPPARVAEAKPEPAPPPAPVAAAPAPEPAPTVAMGAAPEPAPAPMPKRDRN